MSFNKKALLTYHNISAHNYMTTTTSPTQRNKPQELFSLKSDKQ